MSATRPLRIAHLYPEAMNLYGDMGNIRVLQRRTAWRSIAAEVVSISVGAAELDSFDLIFFGGGQDRDQTRIYQDFVDHKRDSLERAVADGAAVLAVCGGYQLLGHGYVDADGVAMAGLGLFDLRSQAGEDRWIGNVLVEANPVLGLTPSTVVGFENHGGRTFLGPGLTPLGRVLAGGGNNGQDGGEGLLSGTVIGTYLHGSLLPKNPALADWLLQAALRHRGDASTGLMPLDDTVELSAHAMAAELARAERGRAAVAKQR